MLFSVTMSSQGMRNLHVRTGQYKSPSHHTEAGNLERFPPKRDYSARNLSELIISSWYKGNLLLGDTFPGQAGRDTGDRTAMCRNFSGLHSRGSSQMRDEEAQ